jgi:hypothetical protein
MSFLETSSGRLFSTLNEASLKHEPGKKRPSLTLKTQTGGEQALLSACPQK